MICFDTSFLIDYYRECEYTETFLESIDADVPLLVPTIVLHELFTGALRANHTESIADIRRDLAETEIVAFDSAAAEEAAEIRATLADQGDLINPLDMLIAGIARQADAEVVAVDRDYGRVPGLAVCDPSLNMEDKQ